MEGLRVKIFQISLLAVANRTLRQYRSGLTMRGSLLLLLSMVLLFSQSDILLDKFQGGIIGRFDNILVPMTVERFQQLLNKDIKPDEQDNSVREALGRVRLLKKRAEDWPARFLRIF